jgi:hypothetical protein
MGDAGRRFSSKRGGSCAIVRFGKALEQQKAAAHEAAYVRHHEDAADDPAEWTEGHGEAQFIPQEHAARDRFEEVFVFEGAEAAVDHAVAEEVGRVEAVDEGDVKLRQAKLAPAPVHGIVGLDQPGGAACDGVEAQLQGDDFHAGGEQEAALEGSVDDDAFAKLKHRRLDGDCQSGRCMTELAR